MHDEENNWDFFKTDNPIMKNIKIDNLGQVWVDGWLEQYIIDPASSVVSKVNQKYDFGWVIGPVTVDGQGQVWSIWYPSYSSSVISSIPSKLMTISRDDEQELITEFDASGSTPASTLAVSDQEQVWLRVEQGIRLINADGSTQDYLFDQPYPSNTQVMVIDKVGYVWTGTYQGLFMLDPKTGWRKFNKSNSGLINDKINYLWLICQKCAE